MNHSRHGVMEGRGAYNRYAKLPLGAATLALPLWEKAVRSVRLDASDEPVVIADYGSSQGKNSFVPMQVAVKVLRECLVSRCSRNVLISPASNCSSISADGATLSFWEANSNNDWKL